MREADELAAARAALRAHLAEVLGPGEVPRLDEALTHPSFANESDAADNQRLEFLGDSVLGLCVSELLVKSHAGADEGKLTRMRSALVNAAALATWARRVGLGPCIALGRGATSGSERQQTNVLADAAEAVVAAVYEAHGLPGARALVRSIVADLLERAEELGANDPKSALQERAQAQGLPAPTYRVVGLSGPPHEHVFEVEVVVGERALARAEGRSKRLAERAAAARALEALSDPPADAPPAAPP